MNFIPFRLMRFARDLLFPGEIICDFRLPSARKLRTIIDYLSNNVSDEGQADYAPAIPFPLLKATVPLVPDT
jgi:hypothetical protein